MSTFIVFAEDWQRHPSSSQHLMQQLGQQHTIIWVNSIGLRSPRLTVTDIKRSWQKGLEMFSGQRTPAQPQLDTSLAKPDAIISPFCLPYHQFSIVRWLNRQLISYQLRRQLKKVNISADEPLILWLALPTAVFMVGALGEQQVVYYCGDDFSSLAGVDHFNVANLEKKLAQRADVILCASDKLTAKFAAYNSFLISHGVDLSLFSRLFSCPPALNRQRPIAGFYGLLADWLDVDFLKSLALQCPQWDFVLIGRKQTDVSALVQCKNVQFIDEMPHAQLPQYASHFQALLLPFRQCQQIEFCNPLKLREYLALGQPILSIPFPAIQPYCEHVFVSLQVNDWVARLQDIATWSELRRQQWQKSSRTAVNDDSWKARSVQVELLLNGTSIGSARSCLIKDIV